DDDVHRLAFSIVGMVLQMFIARDIVDAIRPSLISSHAAVDLWIERLIDYAEAIVQAEVRRRKGAARKKS
ncbi:MAG TPA: CerR family C-terminal domain-containing protein, partial [Oxalicibacterium sp.]|nr:CerR family C-terminal domain-containing protein [Oxalicibacterium sp.]